MKLIWIRYNKYLYNYWRPQVIVIILGFISMALSLINPYLTKFVIDKAYGDKDLRLFLILAIIGGVIFILNGLIGALKSYLSQRISNRVNFEMAKDTFRHLQSLSLNFFNNHSTGEHIYRMEGDVFAVSSFVCDVIPEMLSLFPRLLFILIIVFFLNWKLALFALLLVPTTYIHPYFFGRRFREMTRKLIERYQRIYEKLSEVFSHMRLIKALGKEDFEVKRFEESIAKKLELDLKNSRLFNLSGISSSILNKAVSGIIVLYGGYQVIRGNITLGSLTAMMIYLAQLMALLNSAARLFESIAISSVSCQRLNEIFDTQPQIKEKENALDYRIIQGRIDLRNVFFGYHPGGPGNILQGISFSIPPGSKIALVGPSGCGKTTLISLILRLYDAQEGAILIDGLDIREIKLKTLKEQIGIALQEPFLWNDTVANNILYGAEEATREKVINAAKLAEAHSFIAQLPQQYDTVIGEMACKISEGQKQRLALARALIKKPKILILDEAMSSLDSETEDKITNNMNSALPNSTIIVVSHRLSTVRNSQWVYFLESPSRMEIGTHDELIFRNGRYSELFASQMESEEAEKQKP